MPKEKELMDLVNETCKKLDIKKPPKLFIYEGRGASVSNAASLPLYINRYIFTQGALDSLSPGQLRAVVAHEMIHRKHMVRDTTLFNIAGLTFIALGIALGIASLFLGPAIAILLTIGGLITVPLGVLGALWYRRRIEREADLGAAEIVGPQVMINTLQTLEKQIDEHLGEKAKKIVNGMPPFLRAHPPIDERIKYIKEHTPQKDVSSKQAEEVVKQDQNMGSYTVSAMQSGILSDTVNSAREVETTTAKTHSGYKSRDL